MQFLKKHVKNTVLIMLALVAAVATLAACTSSGNKGQKAESRTQQSNYDKLVAQYPAHTMNYSPTRKTINFWIDTWSKPGQLAYVYLMNSNGDFTGYFVFQGPPVSMCTALTPTYQIKTKGDSGQVVVPAPSIDGAYYSGGECNTYYGKDAQTGAYVEFTIGQSSNMLLYNQPLTGHQNVPKLAPSK
jgi:hypothetical protein